MRKEIVLSTNIQGSGDSLYDAISLIPEGHLLFVGPTACARHGCVVAWKYQQIGKVSYLLTTLEDKVTDGGVRRISAAAQEIVRTQHVRCLTLLMCCSDAVLCMDYNALAHEIESEIGIPTRAMEVNRLYLHGEQRNLVSRVPAQELIFSFLDERSQKDSDYVNLIGPCDRPADDNELPALLSQCGIKVRYLAGCESYEDFQAMGCSQMNISLSRNGDQPSEMMREKLGIPWFPLYASYSPDEICTQYEEIFSFLGAYLDFEKAREQTKKRIETLSTRLSEFDVIIAGEHMDRPCALAKALLENGVNVKQILRTRFSGAEPELENWFQENAPQTELIMIRPEDHTQVPPLQQPLLQGQGNSEFESGFSLLNSELEQLEMELETQAGTTNNT